MRKFLITGIAGFAGSHLAERLSGRFEVWGTCIDDNRENIKGIPSLNLVHCNLLDRERVIEVVRSVKPDGVFHLAAQSIPSLSVERPGETLNINIFSTLNLLEAVAECAPEAVFLNIGSGDEYGDIRPEELPLKETSELRPLNPYSVSKVTTDLLSFQYWKTKGVKTVRCRPFNHFGARQPDRLVASSFAKQIAEIEAGARDKKIKVGNLEAARDFLHVKDVASAYELLIEKGAYGEVYNVSSGTPIMIKEILGILLSFTDEKIEVVEDPARVRAKEIPCVYGDNSKLRTLGWSHEYDIKDGLKDLLDFWRERSRVLA